jgi:carboxylesterase
MTLEAQAGIIRGAETIDLQEGNSRGILLLHGFGDTPQTLGHLANELHSAGYDVRAPLLPGHGRNFEAFAASRHEDWLSFARSELSAMRAKHESVTLAGLSMGGAIAAILAAENPDIPTLVMMAPYMDMPFTHKIAASGYWLWGADKKRKGNSPGSIRDPLERAKNVGYGAYSARLLHELSRLAAKARRALARIKMPTLIIQSRTDPRIKPEVAERTLVSLGSTEKKLVWIEGAGHIITVDYGREQVLREVREWIDAHVPHLTTTA